MELNGKAAGAVVAQALHAALVHVYMGHLRHRRVHALGRDHVAVVLAGDEGPSGGQILDRVVGAPMAEAHLPGGGSGGQGQKLVSQAHREERQVGIIELAHLGNDLRVIRRVAGTVGEHDSVEAAGEHRGGGGVGGIYRHLTAPLLKAADHILLHAVVHQGNPQPLFPQRGVHLALLPGDGLYGPLHPIGTDTL